jgi:4-hydroxy-tetrahydrodipicolinate reductase
MGDEVKIIVYGVGAMGSSMVRLLQSKPLSRVVGAIDHDEAKIGRDIGDLAGLGKELGVTVAYPPLEVLENTEADVVLHATTAFMDDALAQIIPVLDRGINVVTIAQELFFPIGENVEKAKEIDAKARDKRARVSSVGVNPGFIMDMLPILCTLPLWEVDRVFSRRTIDFSPFGPDEMRHIGVGLGAEEWLKGAQINEIGHIGLLETGAMVAHCMGLGVDELRQTKEPVIARSERKTHFATVKPGEVCGFKQNVMGICGDEEVLTLNMMGLVDPKPEEDGAELGDYTHIYGTPSVDIRIKEEIAQKAGFGASGAAVNMIPRILEATPGYHTMDSLTFPHIWRGEDRPRSAPRVVRFWTGAQVAGARG